MTTIAYRAGIMAADTRAWSGHGGHPIGRKTKIRRLDDGRLIGASSCGVGCTEAVLDWYAAGGAAENAPKDVEPTQVCLLVVLPDGRALLAHDHWRLSGPIEAPFYTIGSGKEYAWGAMAAGASAERAVQIAIDADRSSAGPVTLLQHFPGLQQPAYRANVRLSSPPRGY